MNMKASHRNINTKYNNSSLFKNSGQNPNTGSGNNRTGLHIISKGSGNIKLITNEIETVNTIVLSYYYCHMTMVTCHTCNNKIMFIIQ